ncbi:TPA: hypothetical protein ACGFDV_000099 [Klebsiella pneumoniae]
MTSKLTRERLEKIKSWRETYGAGSNVMLPAEEAEELACLAMAAMDSEPVAYISKSDFDAGYPHILARRDFNKACTMPVYAAQPAPVVPVVPDEIKHRIGGLDWGWEGEFNRGWNACRAAMLQELKKSAGAGAVCRSNDNAQVLNTIKAPPALVSLPKNAKSLTGNSPVIPDGSEHCPCCGKKLRRACSVEGCDGNHVAHGLCQKHYDMKRWEDPEQVERFREAGRRYRGKKKTTVATPQEPKP